MVWGSSSSSYLYLYIHYYNYINKRSLFLLLPNEISLLPLYRHFTSFKTVLIDFLTIIKYRKKDINKILNCWLLLFNSERYPSNCWISFCRYAISFPLSSQAVYNWDMIIRKYEVRLLISSNSCFNTSFLLSMTSSCLSALHTPSLWISNFICAYPCHVDEPLYLIVIGCYSFHPW